MALDAAHGADPSSWFQVPKGVPDNVARSRAGTAEPLADTVEARARDATRPRELGRARGPETRHSEESRVERLRPERRHDSCSDRGCFQGAMLLAGPLRGRAPATDGFHEESCFAGKLLRTTASRESCFAGKLPRTTASTEGRFEGAASTALAHRSLVGRSKAKKSPTRFWPRGAHKIRRRPTLPQGGPCSTIGAARLNFRVRDGIGCGPCAIATGNLNFQ